MMHFSLCHIACGLLCFAMLAKCKEKPPCTEDSIKYTYTECDSDKGRWRVAVPMSDNCRIADPISPVFGKECGFSCGRGHYLDINTQNCKVCPPGTYSLGSGIRFNTWESLPDGFLVSTTSFSFSGYGYHSKVANCTGTGWQPQKDYISSNDNDCVSTLSYAIDVKSKGFVSFTYQHTDEDLIFHFYVQNNDCQSEHSGKRNVFLNTTGASWKTYEVDLYEGRSVLIWKSTGLLLGSKKSLRPALIKEIVVNGVSYTTTCHQCLPGFYSDEDGSDWCKPCPKNTFSAGRASKCSSCNESTQYSLVASSSCMQRPACTSGDYYETLSSCDVNETTEVTYKWREPRICRDDMPTSEKLPKSGTKKECPPCNPGFHPYLNGTCIACPDGASSSGKECNICSVGTSPTHAYIYKWWNVMPNNMKVSCMTVHSEDCLGMNGWIPNNAAIETSQSETAVAYLLLKLDLDGFRSYRTESNGGRLYGNLTFIFELKCKENCVLYLMMNSKKDGTSVLGTWHGDTTQTSFTHNFIRNESMTLTWAFQKTNKNDPTTQSRVTHDKAIIHSIVATNAIGAPAVECRSCATGMNDKGCIPCPPGHHVNSRLKKCVKCPRNTYLATETVKDTNCIPCSYGTMSNLAQTACLNDCKYKSKLSNREYDFNDLSEPLIAMTPPSFTSNGRKYVHYYNFSICGNDGFGEAECIDNKSLSRNLMYGMERVSGMICRSTKLFTIGADNQEVSVFTQPIAISTALKAVFDENTPRNDSGGVCGSSEELFPRATNYSNSGDVIYAFMLNGVGETDCSEGVESHIHLRCNPTISKKDASIKTPLRYPDGSCDGCHYYFIWESAEACPLCTEDDYYSIQGACENGYSTTRYMWKTYPKPCKDGVPLPDYGKVPCLDVKFYTEIGILCGIVLLTALIAVSCVFWKKSRKLEYKYQKLVMQSGSKSGELPEVETCAISSSESGDDSDEDVMFRKKRQKMLQQDNEKIPLNSMQHSINL